MRYEWTDGRPSSFALDKREGSVLGDRVVKLYFNSKKVCGVSGFAISGAGKNGFAPEPDRIVGIINLIDVKTATAEKQSIFLRSGSLDFFKNPNNKMIINNT